MAIAASSPLDYLHPSICSMFEVFNLAAHLSAAGRV